MGLSRMRKKILNSNNKGSLSVYHQVRMNSFRCTAESCLVGARNAKGTCVSTIPCRWKVLWDLRFKKQEKRKHP